MGGLYALPEAADEIRWPAEGLKDEGEKEMTYGDLLKFDSFKMKETDPNPCVRMFGPGPELAKCKSCRHLFSKEFARTYYKCEIRGNTGGPGTDHRINWKACARYEHKPNGQERNTR